MVLQLLIKKKVKYKLKEPKMKKMFSKVKNSIVFRIGALLTAMTVLAILSMFSSFVISEMADYDAAAINVSGSLQNKVI